MALPAAGAKGSWLPASKAKAPGFLHLGLAFFEGALENLYLVNVEPQIPNLAMPWDFDAHMATWPTTSSCPFPILWLCTRDVS